MVLTQIQDLLHDHDCVIIPDFGGLIAQYAPARIHPVKHTFTPPSKKIAFNEKLQHNDGLLISSLSRELKISNDEAQQMVAQFVGNLQNDLARNQRCELKGIGIFRYNAERKLEFEYVEAEVNYLSHSFGLPEIVARPIVPAEPTVLRTVRRQTEEVKEVKKKGGFTALTRKYATAAGSLVLGGMCVAFVYYVSLQPEYTLPSLNPASLFQNQSEPSAEKTVALNAEKASPAQSYEMLPLTPEAVSQETIATEFGSSVATMPEAEQQPMASEIQVAVSVKTPTAPVTANATEKPAKTAEVAVKSRKADAPKTVVSAPEKAEAKALAQTEAKPERKTVAKTAEKETVKKEVVSASENRTIKSETGRFFIISGGYSSLANAERSRKDLAAKGADAEVILPGKGSRIHRVSVAEFESMETAMAKLPELRKQYGNALWILNY